MMSSTTNENTNMAIGHVENVTPAKAAENEAKAADTKNKLWMDFEDFCVCFKYELMLRRFSGV